MSLIYRLHRTMISYDNPGSLGSRLRTRRMRMFLPLIEATHKANGRVRIVDIGGTRAYWKLVPEEVLDKYNVELTIVNLPGQAPPPDDGRFRFVLADGCDLSAFADNSFDIAHSNSVLEHVGDWARMVQFANELTRVAPTCYVQTPNFWFPVEPHFLSPFFHWLPKPVQIRLVMNSQLGSWHKQTTIDEAVRMIESARLVNRPMFRELFKDHRIVTERFFGLPKSLVAIRTSPTN